MNRITAKFEALRKAGRKALIGYLTAGDPNPAASERNIRLAVEGGLDILELGVPFSDPTADGPVIQEASRRALAAGMSLPKALALVRRLRRDLDAPIILFGYANPFFCRGYERVCVEAAEAGVDGMLVVDLPFEETGELRAAMERHGLCLIPLIAPTTPAARARRILKPASGFVYYIMFRGVTGARARLAGDLGRRIRALRSCTDLPIAVGFGVSGAEQARAAARHADGVVVGSALVLAAKEGRLAGLVKELSAVM